MNSAKTIGTVLLFLAAMRTGTANFTCDYPGKTLFGYDPTELGDDVVINIQCTPEQVDIKWEIKTSIDPDFYFIKTYLQCKDKYGEMIYYEFAALDTLDNMQGLLGSMELKNINGGECVAYGCHIISGSSTPFYNNNATCSLKAETSLVLTTSTIVSPDASSSYYVQPSTSNHLPKSSVVPITQQSWFTTRVNARKLTTVESSLLSSSLPTQVLSDHSVAKPIVMPLSLVAGVGLPIIIIFSVLSILVYIKSRKRSKHNTIQMWNTYYYNFEKIDPHFTPIQVEPQLKKHESTSSIIEYLALLKDSEAPMDNNMFIIPSSSFMHAAEKLQPPEENLKPTDYILRSPPLKAIHRSPSHQYLHTLPLDRNVVPCLSEQSLSSNESTCMSLSALTLELDTPKLVEEMLTTEYNKSSSSSTIDMNGYYRDRNYQSSPESASTENFRIDLDSMEFDQDIEVDSENYSEPSKASNDCVMLKFQSSPLSDSSEMMDSELCFHMKTTEQVASLTELNLIIDPSHFHPL